jgi:hypothetical protein
MAKRMEGVTTARFGPWTACAQFFAELPDDDLESAR